MPIGKLINLVNVLPRSKEKRYATRPLRAIRFIVIHHSATETGDPVGIARYHITRRGWPGIGYHFLISKEGTVYKCNHLGTICYHATGANTKSVGVGLVGNYLDKAPPAAQLIALRELIEELRKALPGVQVKGHREVSPPGHTVCPGQVLEVL